ncbi:MAG: L,D-transpeptidase family protein [Sphingomicrobium sp.]
MKRGAITAIAALGAATLASPGGAQVAAPPAVSAPLSETGVDLFYATHGNASIWLKDAATRAAAGRLPAIIRDDAALVEDADLLAASVEDALSRGQATDDKIISAAWVRFVRALKAPVRGISYGDPALALHQPSAATVLGEAARSPSLAAHVDAVSRVNAFYSALREAAANEKANDDRRVRATLERLRIIPAKGRAILVDAANARLWMLEDGKPVDSMNVVVGRKTTPTPVVAGTIHYVTFNPYWHIPDDIARRRVAPVVLKRGVSYLKLARYVTAAGHSSSAELVDPVTIDWKAVAASTSPVYIRQLPGEHNMMGDMKFGFVNDFDIFLHDTPKDKAHMSMFAKPKRFFSNGCIRLEHADRLARWILGREPAAPAEGPEQHVKLDQGVPVYVSYLTASVEDGRLTFAEDVYGLDAPAETDEPLVPVDTVAAASDSTQR